MGPYEYQGVPAEVVFADLNGDGMAAASSPTVTNCTFRGNATNGSGGGLIILTGSSLVINCTFTDNTATSVGGGMWTLFANPTITNCTFEDNNALSGAGLFHSGDPERVNENEARIVIT